MRSQGHTSGKPEPIRSCHIGAAWRNMFASSQLAAMRSIDRRRYECTLISTAFRVVQARERETLRLG
jgi:hypothetical protein